MSKVNTQLKRVLYDRWIVDAKWAGRTRDAARLVKLRAALDKKITRVKTLSEVRKGAGAGRAWTEAEDKLLLKSRAMNLTYGETSRVVGRARTGCITRLRRIDKDERKVTALRAKLMRASQ